MPRSTNPYQPVVIIGAGRSGTNLLRDGLVRFRSVATWPCDEINYLWRSGAKRYPTDQLTAAMATERARRRMADAFAWVSREYGAEFVVEKTCANSLRVGYVDAIFPNAKFVQITRDGYDVTASAMKRWTAPIEPKYLARKARFVPVSDLPYYATRYLTGHARRVFSRDKALGTWGPRFNGIDELRANASLAVVCATQWRRCVDLAGKQLAQLAPERVHSLTYESLVADPAGSIREVARFVGVPENDDAVHAFSESVRGGSVGAGRRTLSPAELAEIEPLIEPNRAAGVAA